MKQKIKDLYQRFKKDIFYWLVIANIVIWAVAYYKANQFYNDYVNLLVKSAEAKTKPMQIEEKIELTPEEQIRQIAKGHNFQWTDYLVKLAKCESKLKPECATPNHPDCINSTNKSYDRGWFQISRRWHPEISDECAADIRCSTEFTIEMINNGQQGQWACNELVLNK
jgi:hypothetical protein